MWQLDFTRTRPWSPSTARSSRSRRTSRCCALLVPHKMSAPAVRIPRNRPHAASSSSRVRPVRPEHQAAACLELLAPIQSLDPTGSERCKRKRSAGAGTQALTGPVAGLLDELFVAGELLGLVKPLVAAEVVALIALSRVPVGVLEVLLGNTNTVGSSSARVLTRLAQPASLSACSISHRPTHMSHARWRVRGVLESPCTS